MNHYFDDIISKLGEPIWYDIAGFPRYCKFEPDKTSNIYATFAIYYEIGCQGCGRKFNVAASYSDFDMYENFLSKKFIKENEDKKVAISELALPWFKEQTPEQLANILHYGDPPAHGCVGDTMNCYDLRILEFWYQDNHDWQRIESLETELEKM